MTVAVLNRLRVNDMRQVTHNKFVESMVGVSVDIKEAEGKSPEFGYLLFFMPDNNNYLLGWVYVMGDYEEFYLN